MLASVRVIVHVDSNRRHSRFGKLDIRFGSASHVFTEEPKALMPRWGVGRSLDKYKIAYRSACLGNWTGIFNVLMLWKHNAGIHDDGSSYYKCNVFMNIILLFNLA